MDASIKGGMGDDTFDTSKFYELLNNTTPTEPLGGISPLRFNSTPSVLESPVYNSSRFFPSPVRSPMRSQSVAAMTPERRLGGLAWLDEELGSPLRRQDEEEGSPITSSPRRVLPLKIPELESSVFEREEQQWLEDEEISPSSSRFPSPRIPNGQIKSGGFEEEPLTRVLHYIHGIITRHDRELREYIVSVPELTPFKRTQELIRGVFTSIGDLVSITEATSPGLAEPFRKYRVETWVFTSNLLTTTHLNTTGPWKSIKFVLGERECKMLIFLDGVVKREETPAYPITAAPVTPASTASTSAGGVGAPIDHSSHSSNSTNSSNSTFNGSTSAVNGSRATPPPPTASAVAGGGGGGSGSGWNVFTPPANNLPFSGFNGSSKLQVCWYPEGYSSTLHSRGTDQFMYARELPSKLNVNRQRRGSTMQEMCDIRVSAPGSVVAAASVSIDVRELEGKTLAVRESKREAKRGGFRARGAK